MPDRTTTPDHDQVAISPAAPEGTEPAPDAAVTSADPDAAASSDASADTVEDRVRATLLQHPGATATELAIASGAGRSTVPKILNRLLEAGTVRCQDGAHPRAAKRWWSADSAMDTGGGVDTDAVDTEMSEPMTLARVFTPVAPVGAGPSQATLASDVRGTETVRRAPAPVHRGTKNRSGSVRLAAGGLRGMVEDHLAENAGEEFSPVALGKVFGRSSGAIANALEALVDLGAAQRSSDKPKRYRAVEDDDASPAEAIDDVEDGEADGSEGEDLGQELGDDVTGERADVSGGPAAPQ